MVLGVMDIVLERLEEMKVVADATPTFQKTDISSLAKHVENEDIANSQPHYSPESYVFARDDESAGGYGTEFGRD